MDEKILKTKLSGICQTSGVKTLHVFGSVARGHAHSNSDVDLLVSFARPTGLVKLIALERRMSEALGRNVDLGTSSSLHPLIRENVKKDLKLIYGE